MRSIKKRYRAIRGELPEVYTSYLCFVRAVKGQKCSRKILSKWFNRLVEKEDYSRPERKEIVEYLHYLSNRPVEKAFEAIFRPGGVRKRKH